ncbi:hypothetical protein Hdeb2414_s0016g00484001 [Helianthus debilis subsp. tardiflorus]
MTTWRIWIRRNKKVFKSGNVIGVVDEIKEDSYSWMVKRYKCATLSLEDWSKFERITY